MTRLVDKNSTIPTSASQVFSTAENNQTAVTVHVLQGEREIASGNKSLGRFDLTGIPPAPRGMPQVEVSFDIDANGILNVSAKDKATGKENKIVIKAGSGLSDAEVQQAIRDAETHAEEDKQMRELVNARNNAEASIHAVQKTLEEAGDQVDSTVRYEVETAITDVEEAVKGDNVENITNKTNVMMTASHKIAQQAYQQEQPQENSSNPDDVVDAEFEDAR